MAQHPIMTIFQFTPDDVMANRVGYATPKQVQGKNHSIVGEIIAVFILGKWFVGGIAAIGMVFLSMFDGEISLNLFNILLTSFFALVLVIAPAGIILLVLSHVKGKLQEQHMRIVHRASGPIRLQEWEYFDDPNAYTLHINNKKFYITEEQYSVLMPYQNFNWHIYHFP